jgi:hypothetical protein
MTIDKALVHPFTDRLVTAYWRLHSYRAALGCHRPDRADGGTTTRKPPPGAHRAPSGVNEVWGQH